MKTIFVAQNERFGRVLVFAGQDEHKAYFPPDKPAGRRIAALGEVVATLGTLGGTQEQSDRESHAATTIKREVIASVWADLVGMARVARALDDEHPDLPSRFKVPNSQSEQAILDAARSALAALTDEANPAATAALVELFVDNGMPDDFVQDLQDDLQAAEAAGEAQDEHSGGRREDTLAIEAQIAIGIKLMEKLDAYMRNRFRDDAVTLGAWITASHLEIRRVRPRKQTQAA